MDFKNLTENQKLIVAVIENKFINSKISRSDFVTALAFLINKYKFKRKK